MELIQTRIEQRETDVLCETVLSNSRRPIVDALLISPSQRHYPLDERCATNRTHLRGR